MADGTESIDDNELLYRRVPVVPEYFNSDIDPTPTPQAFRPRASDTTGLSVSRAKYKTPEQAALNDRGRKYYIAVLRAGDLRAHNIEVEPRPQPPDDPGHAELPGRRYDNRKEDSVEEAKVRLAQELCLRMEGPFPA